MSPAAATAAAPPPLAYPPSVHAALAFVQARLDDASSSGGVDASHDMEHIRRVVGMAARLTQAESADAERTETVLLAAALHDVGDHKYFKSEVEGQAALRAALDHLVEGGHATAARAERIAAIVKRVGFKESLAGGAFEGPKDLETYPELAVVSDADQLDAIGAIGIARCFTFGGARGRPLYDPATLATGEVALPTSMEAYAGGGGGRKKQQQDTVAHFHEKLLHLKGRMRTAEGRRVAEARHVFMEAFLAQLRAEVNQEA